MGGTGGAVLARCRSCPPSPWTDLQTRPLDLFIHQTHLLEIDWAGLYLFSSGPGGKTWACDYKGQKQETLGRRGRRALSPHDSTGLLSGPPRQGQKPGRRSARRGQAPGTGTSPERPIDSAAGGPEPSPVCRSDGFGPSRDRNFKHGPQRRSHTEKKPGTAHLANSPAPPAQSTTYF